MKKILSMISALCIVATMATALPASAATVEKNPDYVIGDINADTKINILDVLTIKRKMLGLSDITSKDVLFSDVNKNGRLDVTDLLAVKKHVLGVTELTDLVYSNGSANVKLDNGFKGTGTVSDDGKEIDVEYDQGLMSNYNTDNKVSKYSGTVNGEAFEVSFGPEGTVVQAGKDEPGNDYAINSDAGIAIGNLHKGIGVYNTNPSATTDGITGVSYSVQPGAIQFTGDLNYLFRDAFGQNGLKTSSKIQTSPTLGKVSKDADGNITDLDITLCDNEFTYNSSSDEYKFTYDTADNSYEFSMLGYSYKNGYLPDLQTEGKIYGKFTTYNNLGLVLHPIDEDGNEIGGNHVISYTTASKEKGMVNDCWTYYDEEGILRSFGDSSATIMNVAGDFRLDNIYTSDAWTFKVEDDYVVGTHMNFTGEEENMGIQIVSSNIINNSAIDTMEMIASGEILDSGSDKYCIINLDTLESDDEGNVTNMVASIYAYSDLTGIAEGTLTVNTDDIEVDLSCSEDLENESAHYYLDVTQAPYNDKVITMNIVKGNISSNLHSSSIGGTYAVTDGFKEIAIDSTSILSTPFGEHLYTWNEESYKFTRNDDGSDTIEHKTIEEHTDSLDSYPEIDDDETDTDVLVWSEIPNVIFY